MGALLDQRRVLDAFRRLKRTARSYGDPGRPERDRDVYELDLHDAALEYARVVTKVVRAGRAT